MYMYIRTRSVHYYGDTSKLLHATPLHTLSIVSIIIIGEGVAWSALLVSPCTYACIS